MKHFLGLLFFSLFALSAQTLFAQHTAGAWKEMSDFHEVMSTTFHPAEEGNLQPLRMKAEELYTRAKSWKASAVPAGYDAAKTKDTLKRLVKQCKVVKKAVKAKKTDAELTTEITKAHDVFHEIMEKCRH